MRKIHVIVVLILLTVCIGTSVISNINMARPNKDIIAQNGNMDLEKVDFSQVPYVDLDGQWEFYWMALLNPSTLNHTNNSLNYVHIPKVWTSYRLGSNTNLPNEGYATYRLHIQLNEKAIHQTMAIYVSGIASAYTLWINDKQLASTGTVGTNKENMSPKSLPKVIYVTPLTREMELVIQVSNFSQRKAGLWGKIKIGNADHIANIREKNIAIQLLAVGPLLFMGLYNLIIYSKRRSEKSPLYFGLVCFFISLRTLFLGDVLLVWMLPGINWNLEVKVEYLTVWVSLPLFLMFIHSLYPFEYSNKIKNINISIGAIFSLLILVSPASIFTYTMQVQEVIIIISFVYAIYVVMLAAIHNREGAILNVYGILVVFAAILNDTLFYNQIIYSRDFLSLGLNSFLIVQAFLLSARFAKSFVKTEKVSRQLRLLNGDLENIVQERTSSLEQSKEQLIQANEQLHRLSFYDPLTGIYNRRSFEMSFGNILNTSIDRPIALMLIDVDFFKEYNDTYGHQAGDECLKKVAEILRETLGPLQGKGIFARWGGEEFIVFLTDHAMLRSKEVADQLRERVLSLKIVHQGSDVSAYITVSIGLTFHEQAKTVETSEQLILEADDALYKAKRSGRNIVCLYRRTDESSQH